MLHRSFRPSLETRSLWISVQAPSADAGGWGPAVYLSPQGHASPSLFTPYKWLYQGAAHLLGHAGKGAHTADGEVIITSAYLKLYCGQNIPLFFIQPS